MAEKFGRWNLWSLILPARRCQDPETGITASCPPSRCENDLRDAECWLEPRERRDGVSRLQEELLIERALQRADDEDESSVGGAS